MNLPSSNLDQPSVHTPSPGSRIVLIRDGGVIILWAARNPANEPMNECDEMIPTRESLLSRLKDWGDGEGWQIFFDTYWRLIYNRAIYAGLTDPEAQDVVQETLVSVAKAMPDFHYRRQRGSFKSWLLNLTRWRMADELRKRTPTVEPPTGSTGTTAAVEPIPDPASLNETVRWDAEWQQNLLDAAVRTVRRTADGKQYQIFDFLVFKGWSVGKVTHVLKVTRATVYLAKHRVTKLIKKEVMRLESAAVAAGPWIGQGRLAFSRALRPFRA